MNFPYFLAKRITLSGTRTFSKLIVRVTVGALALAIFAMIMAVAILKGFKNEITNNQRGFFGDILLVKGQMGDAIENLPVTLTDDQIKEIKSQPNVKNIFPYATKAGIIHVNGEVEGVLLKGIGRDYHQDFVQRMILEGDTLSLSDENGDNQILVSQQTAKRLQLKVGDSFIMYFVQEPVRKRKLVVQGIYTSNSEELDKTYVIGSLDLIRRLNNLGKDEAGGFEVRIEDFSQLKHTAELIRDVVPENLMTTDVVELMPDVFNWLELLDMNDNVIFFLMVLVAVINLISALLISILERSAMIGVLKALGLRNRKIRQIFIYNSAYLIGYGIILGNLIAIIFYFFQKYTEFFKLDPAIYYISFVPVDISILEVALLNTALVTIVLITLILPSMLIGRISPIKTIQFK